EVYADLTVQLEKANADMRDIRLRAQEVERESREVEYEQRSLKARAEELKRNQRLSQQQREQAQTELENLEGELFGIDEQSTQVALQALLEERKEKEEALAVKRIELEGIEQRLREQDEQRLQLEMSIEPRRQAITQLQLDEQAARLLAEQFSEQLNAQAVEREDIANFLRDNQEVSKLTEGQAQADWLQTE